MDNHFTKNKEKILFLKIKRATSNSNIIYLRMKICALKDTHIN